MNISSIIPVRSLLVTATRNTLSRSARPVIPSLHHYIPVRQNHFEEQTKQINASKVPAANNYGAVAILLTAALGSLYLISKYEPEQKLDEAQVEGYYTKAINKTFVPRKELQISDEQYFKATKELSSAMRELTLHLIKKDLNFIDLFFLEDRINSVSFDDLKISLSFCSATLIIKEGSKSLSLTFRIDQEDMKNLFSPQNKPAIQNILKNSVFKFGVKHLCEKNSIFQACCYHGETRFIQELLKKYSIISVASDLEAEQNIIMFSPKLGKEEIKQNTQDFTSEFKSILSLLSQLDYKLEKNRRLSQKEEVLCCEELKKNPLLKDGAELFFPRVKAYFNSMSTSDW